ncbi:MAG: recombinase family protein [Clostridiales bacterium]|nr:recombinase family protein [Clostridiales bacterium]
MRVWLYGRLSNDDDVRMNSLENQLEIVRAFASEKGHRIVGESFDDNVSGMRFDRKGLNQVTQAVDAGKIDAVIVKDLSRLGRHQMQTALFIDYLRQCGVAVISVTEGLNTMDDGHDLIIGVRQLMNDFYAKDIGNKIRHGYREKQKEGIVIKAPFGYWKDRNTGRIRLHPEASVTVQIIYGLYSEGLGQKEITRRLNAMQRKTPKQLHDERCGKAEGKVYRWTYQSVKNVLVEKSYTGLLVNHQTETHGRTVTPVPEDEQYLHEDFYPVIIDREEWEQVQALLKANAKPYRGNTASHRYAGLLTCGDCGSTFVPRIRCWNGSRRVEYICKNYMHHGKEFCPSHRIRETELDARAQQYAEELRSQWLEEQADLRRLHRLWEMKRPAINARLTALYEEVQRLEQEIDDLLLEKIQSGS